MFEKDDARKKKNRYEKMNNTGDVEVRGRKRKQLLKFARVREKEKEKEM